MSTDLPSDPADVWFRYINYPLSGAVDVSQRFIQQMGYINIYNLKTGDEQGSEIEKENNSMGQFFDLSKKTEKIKQKINQSEGIKQKPEHHMLTSGQLNLMIEDIRAWEKIDKNKFDEMVSRIKSAFP